MTFLDASFRIEGEPLTRYGSSPGVTRTFCGRCGTSLTYENVSRPGEVDVTQGSLDDPDALGVKGRLFVEDAAAWELRAHTLPTLRDGKLDGPPLAAGVRTWASAKVDRGRRSPIAGRGCFARAPIAQGEVVLIKGGHVVDRRTLRTLSERLQNSEIGIADGLHLAAVSESEYEDVMLFINHSCAPNVGLRGNIVFVAMRDIAADEELTIDYAMIDDHEDESMPCGCGSPDCRGTITGRDWTRPELQHRYGRFFSTYILDAIDRTEI